MTEESTIQCENCGTLYSDLEEVCPYCGQPQPVSAGHEFGYEDDLADLPPDELLFSDQDQLLPDDEYADYPNDLPLAEEFELPAEEEYPAEDYLPPLTSEPFPDDDIFAVADQAWPEDYQDYDESFDEADDEPDELYDDAYDESQELYDEYDESDEDEAYDNGEESEPRHFKRRFVLGCLSIFLCAGLFYGGIGLLGAYHGLQERTQQIQVEAQTHYQKGQEHLGDNSFELAIAEFELALSLNPNFLAARQALRDAQRTSQAQPTPTSETRSAAAKAILSTVETHMAQENWAEAADLLSQLRDLDSDFQPEQVSELVYAANYQLGFQLLNPDQIEEAVQSFEAALSEQPDDEEITVELAKALLYLDGKNSEQVDQENAVTAFAQLYREDADYLDVKERLLNAYEAYGDELFEQEAWCLAEAQYAEAALIQPGAALDSKIDDSAEQCRQTPQPGERAAGSTPGPQARATPPARRATPGAGAAAATSPITGTSTVQAASAGSGKIYFSAFNPFESHWEILAVPAGGGTPEVVTIDGTMPAVSPNGQLLLYRSEAQDSIGFHIYDLTTGEDRRITILQQHVLPRWGGDNTQFLLVAQEPGTGLWKIQQGFADGKSDPIILRDGRTPDWSPDNSIIAYQGTDPAGNDPGIYLAPFGGGEVVRLTNHESDRSPDFSPNGSQLAYMSTRDGDWDIYTISTAGSAPRQLTTSPSQEGLPVWSPDGSKIAYVSDTGGSWNIYTINADGGSPTRVTAWDGLNRPDWLMSQIWWGR